MKKFILLLCTLLVIILVSAQPIGLSADGRKLVRGDNAVAPAWRPLGFNYDHDRDDRLIEDYWDAEWPTIVSDFKEMKELGANVVRMHIQFGKFMNSATEANAHALAQLDRLLTLAEETGLYIDLTGLGCYHKKDIPAWFDAFDEQARWAAQASFWKAVATVGAKHNSIAWYDLVNEPVVPRTKVDRWQVGVKPLKDFWFAQHITRDPAGRDRFEIARLWVHEMRTAIRSVDKHHLITVGMLPWPAAGFDPQELGDEIDLTCTHVYPDGKNLAVAAKTIEAYSLGKPKPVVVEEIFPMTCTVEQLSKFMDDHNGDVSGWIGFYWGKMIEEYEGEGVTVSWLKMFQEKVKAAPLRGNR